MKKRQAVKIFKEFATGKMTTEDFWEIYKKDEALRNILINDKKREKGIIKTKSGGIPVILRFHDKNYPINPDNLLQVIDINRLQHRYELFVIINRFFLMRGIEIPETEYNDDVKEYLFLRSLLPSYVEIENIELLQEIYSEAPAEYSKGKKLSWCKNRVREMFTYDNVPPEWYQEPEWPWNNGTPMVFSHQETSTEGIERYFFYDKITKEQVIIEQVE